MYTTDQIRAAGIAGEISSVDVEHLIKILEEIKENKMFFKMQHFPDREPNEEFSKTVLVFDKEDHSFCDLGYYDFEKSEWFIIGGMSMNLICWCYILDPSGFLKNKDFKSEKNSGYC